MVSKLFKWSVTKIIDLLIYLKINKLNLSLSKKIAMFLVWLLPKNSALRAINKSIKDDETIRERYVLSRFLKIASNIVDNWSNERHSSAINAKIFDTEAAVSLKLWTSSYQWAKSTKNVVCLPKNTSPSHPQNILSFVECCRFLRLSTSKMSLTSSTHLQQQHHESVPAATRAAVANRIVLPIRSQPRSDLSMEAAEEEEQKLFREFENRVLDLVRALDWQFPYKKSIVWSIEYGENKEYCIHVMSNRHHSRHLRLFFCSFHYLLWQKITHWKIN